MSAAKHRAICNAAFPEAERRCHAEWERCDALSKQYSGNAAAHFAEAGRYYADAACWFAAMAERIGPETPPAVVRQARNAAWECLDAAAAHISAASTARASLSEKRRRARQRAEREAAGLCIQCGREPTRPGRKTGEAWRGKSTDAA